MKNELLLSCAELLDRGRDTLGQKKVLTGFDAYIDHLARPIRAGSAGNVRAWFDRVEDLGGFLSGRKGRNCSLELDQKQVKLGGNAPNCAHALGTLGIPVACVAPLGAPTPHPVFAGLSAQCRRVSVGEPGMTVSLEFEGSKVMLCINNEINALDWSTLLERISLDKLRSMAGEADLLYFLNWGEMPGATAIFRGMAREVLTGLPKKPRLIMDLSDCSRRGREDLLELTGIIHDLTELCRVTLSLNANESDLVCGALGIDPGLGDGASGELIRQSLRLDSVVIHRRDCCTSVLAAGVSRFRTRMNGEAVINTGAGDNFNAGLGAAALLEMPREQALALASMTAGYYVETGASPTIDQLIQYLRCSAALDCEKENHNEKA